MLAMGAWYLGQNMLVNCDLVSPCWPWVPGTLVKTMLVNCDLISLNGGFSFSMLVKCGFSFPVLVNSGFVSLC